MQRITISLDETLGEALDRMTADRAYGSRSEAVRDLVREGLERWRIEQPEGSHCVANLSYVVDRRVRGLPQRIADMQHAHHDLVASSMTVRLDHFHSLDTVVLKGATEAVRDFADRIRSERGIRLGSVNMLQVEPTDDHADAQDHRHHGHHHLSPLN
jgi:CopG family nickel-responsive transcriptional regulator